MIRIQKLKQPKKNSGQKLLHGQSMKIRGVEIRNTNKYPLFVDTYERKQKPGVDL